jgi:hypothetical protein
MGESLLQGFPEAAPPKPTEELVYADVRSSSTLLTTKSYSDLHPGIIHPIPRSTKEKHRLT